MAKSLYPVWLHNSLCKFLAADSYITCPTLSQSSSGRNTMGIIVPIIATILLNCKATVKSWGGSCALIGCQIAINKKYLCHNFTTKQELAIPVVSQHVHAIKTKCPTWISELNFL